MESSSEDQSAVIYNNGSLNLNQYVVNANYYRDPNATSDQEMAEDGMNHHSRQGEREYNNSGEGDDDDMVMIEEEMVYQEVVKENQAQKGKISK